MDPGLETLDWPGFPSIMDPEPRVESEADRRLRHLHVASGGPAHTLFPVDLHAPELLREDRTLEPEPVAPVRLGPGEDGHHRRSRLQLNEREGRRRRRRPFEEPNEHGFPRQDVLVDQDRDRFVSGHRPQELLRRLPLGDWTVSEPSPKSGELLLEERVVKRTDDRRDRLSQETRDERSDLPAPEVRGEKENPLPAGPRGAQVLFSLDRHPGKKVLARESAGLEEIHER